MGNLNVITNTIESQPLNENFANNCGYGVSTNGTDAYAITPVPAPVEYIAGQMFRFKADVANTGACTLNVNTLGAKAIKMEDGSDPTDGVIKAGAIVTVVYDGTKFMIPNSGLMSHLAENASEHEVINRRIDNLETMYSESYGYKIDETNSNPETAVTYLSNSIGKTPATAGDGASTSWDATPIYSGIKPCMFKDGAVNYYLSKTDITKKEDGVTPADITTGADGDVMMEFDRLYWKMNRANTDIYAYLAKTKVDSEFKALAHIVGNTVKNKIYIGVYPGIILAGKLRSLGGQTPTHTQTIGTFRTAAQANGAGYQQFGYYQWLMLQHLFYLRFKNRDSQAALGKGYTNLDVIKATGDTNVFPGLYYGTISDQVSMKCFGIEALWDYQVHWTDGLFMDTNRCILISNQTVYNDNGAGYTNFGQGATADLSGYIGTVQGGTETGFIVKTTDGSSTTKYADGGYLTASRMAASGGYRAYGATSGIGRLHARSSGANANASIGGRLVFLGTDNGIA